MVVHDFDLRRAFQRPDEAHAELVVDADRVLPLAIAHERLKAIAGRRPQVAKIARGVEIAQFPARPLTKSAGKPFGLSPLKTASVVLSRKLLITKRSVSFYDTEVKSARISH